VHQGIAPYQPNSLDGGEPRPATETEGAYVHRARAIRGQKVRESPVSFSDHYSQAAMFWQSMSDVEQAHMVEAFSFELGKCTSPEIRERMVAVLADVDPGLARAVAGELGLVAPKGRPPKNVTSSPALSMVTLEPGPIAGRVVGVVADEAADVAGIARLRRDLAAEKAVLRVIAPRGGTIGEGRNQQLVERTLLTTRSTEFDAVLVAAGTTGLTDPRLALLLQEAYRHCKAVGGWGDAEAVLAAAGIDPAAPGVVRAKKADAAFAPLLIEALGRHRAWDRLDYLARRPGAPV
jgi:catalase